MTGAWASRALAFSKTLKQPAGQRRDASIELEPQQFRRHPLGRHAGARAERIDVEPIASHVRKQALGNLRGARARLRRRGFAAAPKIAELREHVLCRLDELAPRLDERVTALAERRMDRAGNREYLAFLVGGDARGDEGGRCEPGRDHQAALRELADPAVASGSVVRK